MTRVVSGTEQKNNTSLSSMDVVREELTLTPEIHCDEIARGLPNVDVSEEYLRCLYYLGAYHISSAYFSNMIIFFN
jgi:hypothetical protein